MKVCDLVYLTHEQQKVILNPFVPINNIGLDRTKTISQLFEEQVLNSPNSTAVKYKDTELTYNQLNEKANQLAHYLRIIYQITPDSLVAICLDRNENMLISILAILKSGGAYVPIDPTFPSTRISYQLKDTSARIVLTSEAFQEKLESIISSELNVNDITVCALDSFYIQQQLIIQPKTNLHNVCMVSNLAYVIYTSGTTGNPKGVMIEHISYINLIISIKNLYFTGIDKIRTYSVTNYVFDIFGLEYGLPLLTGGTITIGIKDFMTLDCSEFHFIQMTPSLCKLKLNYLLNTSYIKLFLGGEKLSKSLLSSILRKNIETINFYGPTETTIWSSSKLYKAHDSSWNFVTLGKPLENQKIYILTDTLTPLPVGAVGEIYIGGIGVARGYLNNVKLTQEKFIQNPFSSLEKCEYERNKLYKTGDLGRWLQNGEIEYIGRNDSQVKINGYRIELGEIESAILNYKGIEHAVILKRKSKKISSDLEDEYLVGYYITTEEKSEEDILNYLRGKLPSYALPIALIRVDNFPLTVNGKLDEKALLDLPLQSSYTTKVLDSQNNEYEKIIVDIWAKVLGIDTVNKHDNFFDLGGNSLLLTAVYAQLPQKIKEKITIMHFFQYTTAAKIATFLSQQFNTKKNDYD